MAQAVYCGSCPDHADSLCVVTHSDHHTILISVATARTQAERDEWLQSTGEIGCVASDGSITLGG